MYPRPTLPRRLRAALLTPLLALALLAAGAQTALAFSAHGSVEQVYATGLSVNGHIAAPVALLDRHGQVLARKSPDELGGVLFRNVAPGHGYRVRQGTQVSPRLTVLPDRSAPPSTALYRQAIPTSGYGYLTVRDGVKLAIDVRLPLGASGPGPYPTLIEYAGYGYADPAGPDSGIAKVAQALGFAVVDVNMRGTGCSGGAFNYFEPLQSLDGYDVIETVARQPWVLHHKVGMLGISYGGISQLFVGATAPPHLAAIAPLSVIDNTVTTLYPGGILNTGFAVSWARDRDHDAEPAGPNQGQSWAYARIQGGDETCAQNQALHGEAVNLLSRIRANRYYVPSIDDPINPFTFVHRIKAPVFMACQFTDEQTGGHCPDLAERMTGTRHRWFTFTNGVHTDSLDPYTFDRFYDFLELYVARAPPHLSAFELAAAPIVYETALGIPGVTLPPDPIQSEPSYAAALAAYQRLPEIRVLFDNGAGGSPGYPYPRFERSFARFPIPGTRAAVWYLDRGGTLGAGRPRRGGADRFTWDPSARPLTDFSGNTGAGGLWGATPAYDWTANPAGTALSYITAPLRHDTVVIGAGSVQAWIRASVPDVDLQVTVSEVRPDGRETFVQNGWLRTSVRALAPGSTPLEPALSLRRASAAPLRRGRYTLVTIPLYYEGHAYRAGSRIRIIISAPNGDQPVWSFSQLVPARRAQVWLARSPAMASRLVLPVVPGVVVTGGLPPCPGLRGEPCRPYRPLHNRSVALR
ncbi:MAG TPA: CocE/NonD family hydrolase [Solirubrobacteraceae bacterium]|nr:CocE/NonD family hydrolase [Solirubrobacteraceae bacterium]